MSIKVSSIDSYYSFSKVIIPFQYLTLADIMSHIQFKQIHELWLWSLKKLRLQSRLQFIDTPQKVAGKENDEL